MTADSDEAIPGRPMDEAALRNAIQRAAAETPGVLRLEPSMRSLLATAASKALSSAGADPPDVPHGVELRLSGARADVTVDLSTASSQPAVDVAQAVRDRVAEVIDLAGFTTGEINVRLLAFEPRTAG